MKVVNEFAIITVLNKSFVLQLGPRMDIQLIKIEDGLCSGEVLFHEFST